MSEKLDFIRLHQVVVSNEQEKTDYTKEVVKTEIAFCRVQHGREKTDDIVSVAKKYADINSL